MSHFDNANLNFANFEHSMNEIGFNVGAFWKIEHATAVAHRIHDFQLSRLAYTNNTLNMCNDLSNVCFKHYAVIAS